LAYAWLTVCLLIDFEVSGIDCFFILVVAVTPSYFNNNQRLIRKIAFLFLRLALIAGWLWSKPQAAANTIYSSVCCSADPPLPYKKADCKV